MRVFNRLYLKVYATVVGTLLLAVAVSATIWSTGPELAAARNAFGMASGLTSAALGDPHASLAEQMKALKRLAGLLEADLAVYDQQGKFIGQSGAPLPALNEVDEGRPRGFHRNPVWKFRLHDGRQIVIRPPFAQHERGTGFLGHMTIVALVLAIGSFPVVRGLTRRLERLQRGVETLGAGNLSVRVKVEGKDEVARVAESFNLAAARIENLVNAHKMLLANASHELRTPLTRLRLGLESLPASASSALKEELRGDIAELDHLIEEILLSSRLDAVKKLESREDIDLLALAAEEASRYDSVSVGGVPVLVSGDARLLRRVLRNLIENALSHGKPPVDIEIKKGNGKALMTVSDHGAGIGETDRERVFEPFFRAQKPGSAERSTGLGLALVRQIARLHNGDADMVAASSFRVTLPECGISAT